ncbi:hypothetical protein E2C01_007863 [Portunus trituberculatus]|uniref:C-type lectin domain-containing protein n=1 Tax=Portunus trituberculatus TaxID=210409 RepID=A0A5B7D047_PORTR|nr:hypothetical protein [Portunus trituberculatus]
MEPMYVGADGYEASWFWVDDRALSANAIYWFEKHPTIDPGCVFLYPAKPHTYKKIFLSKGACTAIRYFVCQKHLSVWGRKPQPPSASSGDYCRVFLSCWVLVGKDLAGLYQRQNFYHSEITVDKVIQNAVGNVENTNLCDNDLVFAPSKEDCESSSEVWEKSVLTPEETFV